MNLNFALVIIALILALFLLDIDEQGTTKDGQRVIQVPQQDLEAYGGQNG